MTHRGAERGQSTVELALMLPVVAIVAVLVVQAGLIVRDQLLVQHAAREGARAAAVDPQHGTAERAVRRTGGLDDDRARVAVTPRHPGRPVTVTVTYRPRSPFPGLSSVVDRLELRAAVTFQAE